MPRAISAEALHVLAEIHVTGLWLWVRGVTAFLNDPQHTVIRGTTVMDLLNSGYLAEDPEELTVAVSDVGRALLERTPAAVAQAWAFHEMQQLLHHASGVAIDGPNSLTYPRS